MALAYWGTAWFGKKQCPKIREKEALQQQIQVAIRDYEEARPGWEHFYSWDIIDNLYIMFCSEEEEKQYF